MFKHGEKSMSKLETSPRHGASVTSQDMDGNTPLMLSAMSKAAGATECMRSLIGARNKYFDLDARNLPHSGGYTALHLAAIGKLVNISKI